jgi:anti-repressor protein
MDEIVKVTPHLIGDVEVRSVNARDLHTFLKIGKDFSTWIKVQIDRARLVEGRDYVKFEDLRSPTGGSSKSRAQTTVEYALTLDAGKHISMMSGSEKGFEVRDYFIECERRALNKGATESVAPNLPDFTNPAVAARAWADEVEKMLMLEQKVAQDAPKVEALDRIAESEGEFNVRESAKVLKVPERRFTHWLIEHGWAFRNGRDNRLVGYADKVKAGHIRHDVGTVKKSAGEERTWTQMLFTAKGLVQIAIEIGKLPSNSAVLSHRDDLFGSSRFH